MVPKETEATQAAATEARAALDQARELKKSGSPGDVRAALREAVAALLEVPDREASGQIAEALTQLGTLASQMNDTECVVQIFEPVLAFRTATLGSDAEKVQVIRATLGMAYLALGETDRSRDMLEIPLEWARRSLPPDDPRLLDAMSNFASVLHYKHDGEGARLLMADVVERLLKTHDADDPEIQWAFANLGNILDKLGDVDGAVANREHVHRIFSLSRPADHADVMFARQNLALSLRRSGDPIAARTLLEDVLAWDEKVYPPGHLSIERTRQNLANALLDLGDFESGRILLEGVVERLEKKGVPSNPVLLNARTGLLWALADQGRHEEAADMAAKLSEACSNAFGPDNIATIHARSGLARELDRLGNHAESVEIGVELLAQLKEKYPDDEYSLLIEESNQAEALLPLGKSEEAEKLFEHALEISMRRLGQEHGLTLHIQCALAGSIEDRKPERARDILRDVGQRLLPSLAAATASLSPREAELRACSLSPLVDVVIARCLKSEDAALVFELVETSRQASWTGTRALAFLDRACASDDGARKLRDDLRSKSAQMAEFAQSGRREEYQKAALERGLLEQRLTASVAGLGPLSRISAKPAEIAKHLPDGSAAISFRRYDIDIGEDEEGRLGYYAAFVLRHDGSLRRVELGPAAAIERALERWRTAIGIGASAGAPEAQQKSGVELRELLVDKLREPAGDARRWIVAPDDVLHLIPLEALPQGDGVVGDEIQIELRTHLGELTEERAKDVSARDLVALGGIDFDAPFAKPKEAAPAVDAASKPVSRGGGSELGGDRMPPRPAHFPVLVASGAEVAAVAGMFRARPGETSQARVLAGAEATKSALAELAPRARWLHIATHGFSAPEAIASLDASASSGSNFEREVRGLSPRVLCGLALAGANAPVDVVERTRGVLTAEELAYLDLNGCELAVLSACDSSLGVRRSGQSVASLQSALHAAGARSALTARWSVSDEATSALMLAFYKGIWVDHLPKGEALWRAKNEMRRRRSPTREWAAWVLTGEN